MKCCEYQGKYLDWDDDAQEEQDVIKCTLFTDKGIWDEYCYCDEEEAKECKLKRFVPLIEEKDKEIERLKEEIKEWKHNATRINEDNNKLHSIIKEAKDYNEHLIRDAKYHLNDGHLKKMKKILDKVGEE